MDNFSQALQKKGIQDERLKERFKVFCFKYEMEALILAAESGLRGKLQIDSKGHLDNTSRRPKSRSPPLENCRATFPRFWQKIR